MIQIISPEINEIFNPGMVEMSLSWIREQLNHALETRESYDANDHNIALALLHFKDGSSNTLVAYSNDSSLSGYSGESLQHSLGLIPNLYGLLPESERFGCNGMAQYHTEPKLLNYITAPIGIRKKPYITSPLPKNPVLRSILKENRERGIRMAECLKCPSDITHILLATEIDCCPTCKEYSIKRFKEKFPRISLGIKQFGKQIRDKVSPQFSYVTKKTIL